MPVTNFANITKSSNQGKVSYSADLFDPEENPNTKKFSRTRSITEDEYNQFLKYAQTQEYKDRYKAWNYRGGGSSRPTAYAVQQPSGPETVVIGGKSYVRDPKETQSQFSSRVTQGKNEFNAMQKSGKVGTIAENNFQPKYSSNYDPNRVTGRGYTATLDVDTGTLSNEKRSVTTTGGKVIPVAPEDPRYTEFTNRQKKIDDLNNMVNGVSAADQATSQSTSQISGGTGADLAEGSNIGTPGNQDNVNPLLQFNAPKAPDQDAIQQAIDEALGGLRDANGNEVKTLEELIASKRKNLEMKVRADQEAAQASFFGATGGREGAQSLGNNIIANQEVPRAGRQELSQYDAEGEAEVAKLQASQEKEIADLSQKIKDTYQKNFDNDFKIWSANMAEERSRRAEARMERQFNKAFGLNEEKFAEQKELNKRIQERMDTQLDYNIFNGDRNYQLKEWQAKHNIDNQTLTQIQNLKKNFPGTGLAQGLMADYLLGEDPNTGLPRVNPKTGLPFRFEDIQPILETESREKLETIMEFSGDFADLPYATRNMILESYDMENEEKLRIMSDELRKEELSLRKKGKGGSGGTSSMKLTTAEQKKILFATGKNVQFFTDLSPEEQAILMDDKILDYAETYNIDDNDMLNNLWDIQSSFKGQASEEGLSFDDL